LAAGFCPKNIAFARKIMALPESGGLQPPSPPDSYADDILVTKTSYL